MRTYSYFHIICFFFLFILFHPISFAQSGDAHWMKENGYRIPLLEGETIPGEMLTTLDEITAEECQIRAVFKIFDKQKRILLGYEAIMYCAEAPDPENSMYYNANGIYIDTLSQQ